MNAIMYYLCSILINQLNFLDKNSNTEQRILQAAIAVFLRDGYDGARMQQIAQEAGMNQALIHYYFRSKEKLFEKIFSEKMKDFLPRVHALFFSPDLTFVEKLELYIENYMELLKNNPFVPRFMACNAHKYPAFMALLPTDFAESMLAYFRIEIESGRIRQVDPRQFFLSLLGMCIVPFAFRPVVSQIMHLDEAGFDALLRERTEEIKEYIRRILIPTHFNQTVNHGKS